MRRLLVFLSVLLLSLRSFGQTPPPFPDVPVITESSVGRAKIEMPVARLKELYKGCTFTPIHLGYFGLFGNNDEQPSGVSVSYGKQRLFVYFADWQTQQKVAGFIVLHPAYKTTAGVHVGSAAAHLKQALPAAKVAPAEIMPEMEIAQVEKGEEQLPGLRYVFYGQGTIGKLTDTMESSEIAKLTARISWILIYPN